MDISERGKHYRQSKIAAIRAEIARCETQLGPDGQAASTFVNEIIADKLAGLKLRLQKLERKLL